MLQVGNLLCWKCRSVILLDSLLWKSRDEYWSFHLSISLTHSFTDSPKKWKFLVFFKAIFSYSWNDRGDKSVTVSLNKWVYKCFHSQQVDNRCGSVINFAKKYFFVADCLHVEDNNYATVHNITLALDSTNFFLLNFYAVSSWLMGFVSRDECVYLLKSIGAMLFLRFKWQQQRYAKWYWNFFFHKLSYFS